MATISSSLKLFDGFSGPLRQITQAMNMTVGVMRQLAVSTNADASAIRTLDTVSRKLASAEVDLTSATRRATSEHEHLRNSLNGTVSVGNRFINMLKGIASAYLGVQALSQLGGVTIGEAMKQQNYLDMFKARTGNHALGTRMFEEFKADALRAGADVAEYMQGALGNISVTTDIGQLKDLNMMAKQLAAFDNTGQGIQGAFFSLKEALSGDIVSLSERFNIGKQDIRDFKIDELGKKGDVQGFIKAFKLLLDKQNMGKKAFEEMLNSPLKQWEIMLNRIKSMFADAGKGAVTALMPIINTLNKAFESEKFISFFVLLSKGLTIVATGLSYVVDGALWLWSVVDRYYPEILAFFLILSTAYLPALLVKVGSLTMALWGMVAPILASGAAWSIAHWPIVLVAIAVVSLIGTLRYFGVTTEEVVGFAVGLFYTFFASVYNSVAFLWNRLLAFAEFFVNVFIDPVYAVQKLFYDMAVLFGGHMYNMSRAAEDFAGNFMKAILRSINKTLEGFNWLAQKTNEMFGTDFKGAKLFDENNIHAVSNNIKSMMDMIERPTTDRNVVDLSKYRMAEKNLNQAFGEGYYKGFNLTTKTNTPFNPNVNGKVNNIGRVDEVGKIKDKVDISSEDLKVMRELAEMKNIQNFVSLTPTVQVTTGDINNGDDIETIIKKIEKTLDDEIASSAQGVFGLA
ncbi:hypothetical protein [Brevibacillus laterosporus]|uniref:Tail length tape measure protein n=1 Tax=Brevibacillus laterosporus TaxID=1465 RepID=A0AAP3DHQ8_BRELA|nr:hypothetical protein [Brevibacillus laterosporus]MCR8981574.1 hypothetical protein [Brevibacillus laterosporus]MCZ0808729.1 hypothetical protein [Brevibacillus laterosporus]MCZ0827298.1 hypothetical protein [Brevibacillus laterosporus]MCZ0851054.1 hypothetical protein [Brevibacillus laterosporus]